MSDSEQKIEREKEELINAVWNENVEIVKILLEKGADLNIKNKKGNMALDIAEKYRYVEIIKILRDKRYPEKNNIIIKNFSYAYCIDKNFSI